MKVSSKERLRGKSYGYLSNGSQAVYQNGMVASFMVLGLITFIAYKMGGLTKGRVHGSAIAIFWDLSWPTSAVL